MQHTKSDRAHARTGRRRRRIFTGAVAVVGSAGLAAAVLLPSGTALAAYQQIPTGTEPAQVIVGPGVALTMVTTTLSLSGFPGDQPADVPVVYDALTNNSTGYTVTVQATSPTLAATKTTNTDSIPLSDLSVVDDTGTYVPLATTATTAPPVASVTSLVTVHTQAGPSTGANGGTNGTDINTNNYEFNVPIPNVRDDTYTDSIDYIATVNTGGI